MEGTEKDEGIKVLTPEMRQALLVAAQVCLDGEHQYLDRAKDPDKAISSAERSRLRDMASGCMEMYWTIQLMCNRSWADGFSAEAYNRLLQEVRERGYEV